MALQALKQAEAAETQRAQASTPPTNALPPALQAACRTIGQHLPALWPTDVLSQAQRKAVLRCLIDQVGLQRARRDQMHPRMVWRGGETTTFEVPVAVGALTDLPGVHEMAQQIRVRCAAGTRDDERARQLTQHGDRSPSRPAVLPKHSPGHPPQAGSHAAALAVAPATDRGVPDGATARRGVGDHPALGVSPEQTRQVVIQRDAQTRLSLFPDCPETLEAFGPLRAGSLSELRDGAPSRRRAQPRLGGRGRSFRAAPPPSREAETVVIENKTYHKNLLTRLAEDTRGNPGACSARLV